MTSNQSETDAGQQGRTKQSLAYLGFAHPNVGYVIDGLEDATVRVGLERDLKEGQHVQLRTPENNVFGYAKIEDVYEGRLSAVWFDMAMKDKRNHPAHSDEDLLERLQDHYPDRELGYDSSVTVVYFDCYQVGGASA